MNKIPLSQSGLEILLHPIVIMNIADHYTRTKLAQKDKKKVKISILFSHLHLKAKSNWCTVWNSRR